MPVAVVWELNVLDIIAVVLALMAIIVTVYLAYHTANIHSHLKAIREQGQCLSPDKPEKST